MGWIKEQITYLINDVGVVVAVLFLTLIITCFVGLIGGILTAVWAVFTVNMWALRGIVLFSFVIACAVIAPEWIKTRKNDDLL